MVEISVLASGSSGNCFFFQGNGSSFLVDAGISCKQVCLRLDSIGKNIRSIKGIFVTHEHSDHVCGLKQLDKQFQIPIFMTRGTMEALRGRIPMENVSVIDPFEVQEFNGILIEPFLKNHDANEPVSYTLSHEGMRCSFITDVGSACRNVINQVRSADVLVLESNHDEEMLRNGRYPYPLKKRISGGSGHLSNYDSSLLVLEHAKPTLQEVYLSHLSEENNSERIAVDTFRTVLSERRGFLPKISMTYRGRATIVEKYS